jgi:sugar phosphate isomerase/epimerase
MSKLERRDFLKAAGASAALPAAAALGHSAALGAGSERDALAPESVPGATKYPKFSIITNYSPEKLRFAASAGYEGVVLKFSDAIDPDKATDASLDSMLAAARDAGVRIVSIECMWGFNHIARDPAERRAAQARFIRALELGHRLGCKFVGTFSGGTAGASVDDQVKALAAAASEQYMPVCDKLDMQMGWENYPCDVNFATVPAIWNQVFALVPNPRLGLEFDPSHLVRQYIDPVGAAREVRARIHAVHAKDTEIIQPVLQQVGIHGKDWWRYRIPGQGLIDWPAFITVLLQAGFAGGLAVEHEDDFWDAPPSDDATDFPQERKDGFVLASRFLRMYLPGRSRD